MKITDATTLGQLGLFKDQIGAQFVHVTADGTRRRALVHHPKYGFHVSVADTEAEALDGAFQALVSAIGEDLEVAAS